MNAEPLDVRAIGAQIAEHFGVCPENVVSVTLDAEAGVSMTLIGSRIGEPWSAPRKSILGREGQLLRETVKFPVADANAEVEP